MNKDLSWKILGFFQKILRALPYSWSVTVGAWVGGLLRILSKKRVDEAERRCVRALQAGVTRAREIVKESYKNLGRSIAEFISLDKGRARSGDLLTIHGEEHLKKAIERGKGVILLSAHMGNWELGAAALAKKGYPMNAIGADQRDDRITDLIIKIRDQSGVSTVSKGFDLKAALRCLKRGEALAILIDQDVRDKGVIVPFLGLPASTPYGPAKIARKLESTLLITFMVRRGTSIFHDLYILPSPWEKGFPQEEETMESAMTLCNDAISRFIQKWPEQWMWLYPRWASTEKDLL